MHHGFMTEARKRLPKYKAFHWPTIVALREIGGSGSNDEIAEAVIQLEGFSEEDQAILHGDGPQTEIEYRLAWARSWLKGMGLTNNSKQGIWSLTEYGRSVAEHELPELRREYVADLRAKREAKKRELAESSPDEDVSEESPPEGASWQDELLEAMMAMDPAAFERLTKRLLREAGFINTTVTGRSGDGGIDGTGTYRMSLISFPVFFQCKRYRNAVGPGAVRDFRGAMAGRGEKGLLITTGSFTADAKRESTRDGAPPVDLIDGTALCELLKRYEIGVEVEERTVEDVTVDPSFFASI